MPRTTIASLTKELQDAREELRKANLDRDALRTKNSALRSDVQRLTRQIGETVDKVLHATQPAETERLVRIAGRLCRIVTERIGQRVVKRYIPAEAA